MTTQKLMDLAKKGELMKYIKSLEKEIEDLKEFLRKAGYQR